MRITITYHDASGALICSFGTTPDRLERRLVKMEKLYRVPRTAFKITYDN